MYKQLLRATVLALSGFIFWQCNQNASTSANTKDATLPETDFTANYGTPTIDGSGDDAVWVDAEWLPLNQIWLGDTLLSAQDFQGRYKIAWDESNLYLLAEITDDTLIDIHADGLDHYWDDDCLEVFLDADASGGNHQYNYNAFAYHIALDGKVVDIAPDSSFQYYTDHVISRRQPSGKSTTWELAIKVYNGNDYKDGEENIPDLLKAGRVMGFALAYCDNDHSPERENFIGNVPIAGEDKNRGWIDASLFGTLGLRK